MNDIIYILSYYQLDYVVESTGVYLGTEYNGANEYLYLTEWDRCRLLEAYLSHRDLVLVMLKGLDRITSYRFYK